MGLSFVTGSTSAAQTKDPTTTGMSCAANLVVAGSSITCNSTVTDTSSTPNQPTGSVTFSWMPAGALSPSSANPCSLVPNSPSSSACGITFVVNSEPAGSPVAIVSAYSGDVTHLSSTSNSIEFFYSPAPTSTSVSCGTTTLQGHKSTDCTSTVTDTPPYSGSPTGSVSWTCSPAPCGVFSPTSCTLGNPTGTTASCSVTFTSTSGKPGSVTLQAAYSGDSAHMPSSGTITVTAGS